MMGLRLVLIVLCGFLVGGVAALVLNPGGIERLVSGSKIQQSGVAKIGGAFSLLDHTGKRVTQKDFFGRYMLIYFGFTYCPDVCPSELQVIAGALNKLGAKAENVTPVFVTIDPDRDTVEQMASYVSNFHPRLVGLTGTPDEIAAMAKVFRIYYSKVADETSSDDYTMDHSSIVYLFDKQGRFVSHFPYGTGTDKMAAKLDSVL